MNMDYIFFRSCTIVLSGYILSSLGDGAFVSVRCKQQKRLSSVCKMIWCLQSHCCLVQGAQRDSCVDRLYCALFSFAREGCGDSISCCGCVCVRLTTWLDLILCDYNCCFIHLSMNIVAHKNVRYVCIIYICICWPICIFLLLNMTNVVFTLNSNIIEPFIHCQFTFFVRQM